jgi:hypothetical protein
VPEIDYRVERDVAVIAFANPPVNGLSPSAQADVVIEAVFETTVF